MNNIAPIVSSFHDLEKQLGFKSALPVTEHWSAAADFLKTISDHCAQNKPKNIVECSSGVSSLVLARCCSLNQYGHVYSLESDLQYVNQTQRHLDDFCLSRYCDVIHAPLYDVDLAEQCFKWYQLDDLDVGEIDVLVIDGPPGFIQEQSRYPALPMLYQRLAEKCVVFLDDAARDDEQIIVDRWLKEFPEFQAEYIENERGCFSLRRG